MEPNRSGQQRVTLATYHGRRPSHPLASSVRSKPFLNAVSDILRFTKRIGGSSVLLHSTGLGIHRDMRYRIAAPCGAGLPLLRVTTAAPADSSEEPRGCATGHSVGFHNLGVGMAVPVTFGSVESTLPAAKCLPTSVSLAGQTLGDDTSELSNRNNLIYKSPVLALPLPRPQMAQCWVPQSRRWHGCPRTLSAQLGQPRLS